MIGFPLKSLASEAPGYCQGGGGDDEMIDEVLAIALITMYSGAHVKTEAGDVSLGSEVKGPMMVLGGWENQDE